jgi:starch-binding outer membrane protein, SusD/RagB family
MLYKYIIPQSVIEKQRCIIKYTSLKLLRQIPICHLMQIKIIPLCLMVFVLSQSSCKKLIEVDPPSSNINAANVFNNDATAISVITSIYSSMSNGGNFTGNASLSVFAGLSADELTLFGGVTNLNLIDHYRNSLSVNNGTGSESWSYYTYIQVCNSAIEGLHKSNNLTPSIKDELLGEAKFMRAFFYFYLVNIFGEVPLVVSTDYKVNASLENVHRDQLYEQIIMDLKDAKELLSENYLDGTLLKTSLDRIRPNKSVATALLARVYLYNGDWVNAEAQSSELINNISMFSLNTLSNAFLKASLGNKEAIWQLQPVIKGWNTEDAYTFIIPSTGPSNVNGRNGNPVFLSNNLLNSFESLDQRKTNGSWIERITVNNITYYYPYKYRSASLNATVTEYLMVFRLAEQYLIRAEARANLGNSTGAVSDLDKIRQRAKLPVYNGPTTQDPLLTAILHERQVELFTEWGHRWFDIKRTGTVDAIMSNVTPLKANGAVWQSFQKYYPIPLSDIGINPNLSQTPGY